MDSRIAPSRRLLADCATHFENAFRAHFDYAYVLYRDDAPQWQIALSWSGEACVPFREEVIWTHAGAVAIGGGSAVYFDLAKGVVRSRLDVPTHFGHLALDPGERGVRGELLYVLTSTDVVAVHRDLRVRWSTRVAVDGVTFLDAKGPSIRVNAEMDPPGGWFEVTLEIGDRTRDLTRACVRGLTAFASPHTAEIERGTRTSKEHGRMITPRAMNTRRILLISASLGAFGCGAAQSGSSTQPDRTASMETAPTTSSSAPSDPSATTASTEPPAPPVTASSRPTDDSEEESDNTGRDRAACAGLYDDDHGIPPASRTALASYFLTGGFGRDMRFEVRADRSINYVAVDREGPRCFRGTVTPEALDAFRTALQRAGACRLPRQTGRPVPDRGPLTLAFRLPGLSCNARIVHGSEADFDRLENVYRAFDALGAPVCGAHCRRMAGE